MVDFAVKVIFTSKHPDKLLHVFPEILINFPTFCVINNGTH